MIFRPSLLLTALFAFVTAAHATDIPLVGDASVSSVSGRTTTNYGSTSNLYVGSTGTTYLQFDTTQLPTGTTAAQVTKATLLVFVNRVNTAAAININVCTTAWAESTVTSATAPTCGTSTASFTPSVAGVYIPVDVTTAVKNWVGGAANDGLSLTSTGDMVFDSKENDQTAHPAKLDVTLANQGAAGAAGPQGPAGATGPSGPTGPTGSVGSVSVTNSNATGSASVNTGTGALTINFPAAGGGTSYYFTFNNTGVSPFYAAPFDSTQSTPNALSYLDFLYTPVSCTLQDFNVLSYTVSPGTAVTFTATVYKNGSLSGTSYTAAAGTAQTMACSLTEAAATGGKATCTSANTVSLAAGDNFYLQLSESNAANDPYGHFAVTMSCR